ncbi:MAG: hypothetical protein CM15mL4_0120 [uncultured marine virus]|nr:MAG: hypothetical protein CM15mL4_0120 [uncultured marine virus]
MMQKERVIEKAADKAFERRKKLSGTLYDKTGSFHDRADND